MKGRQEYEKSAAVRFRILTATRRLLAEYPATALPLRRIAAAAGLSHAGLLHHYPTKAALLTAAAETPDGSRDAWLDTYLNHHPHLAEHRRTLETWVRLSRLVITLDASTRSALVATYRDAREALSHDDLEPRELLSTLAGLQLLADLDG